ncbi:MAG TPA: hypothetical protein VFK79_15400 [Xanthobacteraceae bacterium]|nr:hypothetical protein [Xanthobacteraceae bacterium]
MKKIVLAALLLALPCGANAQQPGKTPPLEVTAQLDKTAIWVGDHLRYTIRAVYQPNVELVLDNFTKERLPLAPFVIREIDIRHKDWAAGKKAAEITLTLTTFETRKGDISIPLVPLYYFVREPGAADKERPVDSIAAPAMPVGLRSALVAESLMPRTNKPPESPGLTRALLPLGLGLAGILALGAYGGRRLWRRMHPDEITGQLSREARERVVRESLSRLHIAVPASGEDPREWSGAMASTLRGMISELFQIPGAAQTPEEIGTALARAGADVTLAAQVKGLLGQCDELRYGRDSSGAERLRAQLLQSVEALMQSPRWVSA